MNHATVVICNYNYEHYLAAAIDSALAQDYPATRVLVVDDDSTDGSRAIIEQYGARVSSIYKENGGQKNGHACALRFVSRPLLASFRLCGALYLEPACPPSRGWAMKSRTRVRRTVWIDERTLM